MLAGYIAYFLILIVVGFAIWIFLETYYTSKSNFISAAVTMWPGISNSTTSNITLKALQACQCISVSLPGSLSSVKEALDYDKTNLTPSIYNI